MVTPAPAVVAVLGQGLVPPDRPVVRADDLGLTRGDGCFDATRVHRVDGAVVVDHLDAHLDRLIRSADRLGLVVDRAAWQELITVAVAAWDAQADEATVKLVLTAGVESQDGGPTGLVMIIPASADLAAVRQGLDVITLARNVSSRGFTDAPWLLGGVKTISYALNRAASRQARLRGADDALWVSIEGHLLEAPTSTLIVRQGDRLVTPDPEPAGLLASITAQVILQGAPTLGLRPEHGDLTVDDVTGACGAWLVSSVRGVVPIRSLDGAVVAQDAQTTAALRALAGF